MKEKNIRCCESTLLTYTNQIFEAIFNFSQVQKLTYFTITKQNFYHTINATMNLPLYEKNLVKITMLMN